MKSPRRKPASIAKTRWAVYAAAGAATAIASAQSMEAAIHYSGIINRVFDAPPGSLTSDGFSLGAQAAFQLAQGRTDTYPSNNGAAFFNVFATTASFRGLSANGFRYPSKLRLHQRISTGSFVAGNQFPDAFLAFHSGLENSQWLDRGTGFVGFKFNVGNGIQYGWARLRMGGAPLNRFILVDYAWGDPGDRIRAGQRREPAEEEANAVPTRGSLGLLALGAAGLLAWRRRRSERKAGRPESSLR